MLSKVKIDAHSIVKLNISARYTSVSGSHRDTLHFEKFNVWRDADLLPDTIREAIMGQVAGFTAEFNFECDTLLAPYDSKQCYQIKSSDFNRQPQATLFIEPRLGRYYPRGWFNGIANNYSENRFPARVISLQDDMIGVDFNHPLAGVPIGIDVEVLDVYQSADEHGGRCNDCIADVLAGPGMQLRIPPGEQNTPVDFFADNALDKPQATPDSVYYQIPREVNHLDEEALAQLSKLYAGLLPENARILDLMSSINSHLPEDYTAAKVVGLGMNERELQANPRLDEHRVHDLNQQPHIPFDDSSFDVVMCNLSVEYLSDPLTVFSEINRVLDDHGLLLVSFSNRWFPGMAIQLWPNLHEYERVGLVSEYVLQSEGFTDLNTFSLRGLPRPENDKHKQPFSDPLYVVWARKQR